MTDNIAKGDPFRRAYGTLSDDQKTAMDITKKQYELVWYCLAQLEEAFGSGRDLSIARTKLQESCMWAGRAITKMDYQE